MVVVTEDNSKADNKNLPPMRLYGESCHRKTAGGKMLNFLSNIVLILAIWVVVVFGA